jgi:23S rRNA (guanosine2251-2'-O)-methyltransferase
LFEPAAAPRWDNQSVTFPIAGIHPVREALRAGRTLERVLIVRGTGGARMQEIVDLCREHRVPVRYEMKEALDRLVRDTPHQGVVAYLAVQTYATVDEFLDRDGLLVVLDGVEDPHNLGAIIRTAHAAGAMAVVVGERRAAPLNETVAKASAGAIALLPVVRVVNLNRTLEQLKENSFWIYGLDERGDRLHTQADFAARSALVVGGEGPGLHEQIRKKCDFLLRIPMAGQIASLNVSVATGVVLFEWARARGFGEGPAGVA